MQEWRRRTMKGNKMASQFSSLLNEHWKRKQRLKDDRERVAKFETNLMIDSYATSDDYYKPITTHANYDVANKSLRTCANSSALIPTPPTHRTKAKESTNSCSSHAPSSRLITLLLVTCASMSLASSQSMLHSDPRPTIYSGQVSFGLLLSAHSSHGSELSTAASTVVASRLAPLQELASVANDTSSSSEPDDHHLLFSTENSTTLLAGGNRLEPQLMSESVHEELIEVQESQTMVQHLIDKRQIFEHRRANQPHRRQQQQQQQQQQVVASTGSSGDKTDGASSGGAQANMCGQVNANSLYAGMGAIWASHQANLVGDSHLAIGTYVYDSCDDLDVGQRQSVRIVSNLNAFQQTTCEAPRGSPISLTIAHGDNQLRAIQLLTSFRVPVITTREHFALEDYHQLSRDQRRFLFTTAPSSRHLAMGALRFSRRIVTHTANSAKLPNQFYKMSPKNGLIVVSRNLPARFIAFLTEMIPREVNYEMLYSSHPIDQIRSVEALESILIKTSGSSSSSSSSSSESRLSHMHADPTSPPTPPAKSKLNANKRGRRSSPMDPSDGDSSDGGEYDSMSGGDDAAKMLSPTILMFITPSEAIDLVTRLRNDLAEVSRYYTLIVSTREDITPALRTIFHRGGARLCSGKAFYTVSPKPDDIGEFSRYFRDTVQMEGEHSDHPLVCEFAKYQSTSRINADLDDTGTEPVIKAVWSAAAAFKAVHRRECGSLIPSSNSASTSGAGGSSTASAVQDLLVGASQSAGGSQPGGGGRTMHSRQSNKSAHAECMVRMNKNMSVLVQKALKRLDVTINSTGLQALDGFRLKFDDLNELMTNKFSIRYINKECDITDIGHYTGLAESKLTIDQESFNKSLEGSMPEPWPVAPPKPPAPAPPAPTRSPSSSSTSSSTSSSGDGGATGHAGSSDSSPGGKDAAGDGESESGGSKRGSGGGRDKSDVSAVAASSEEPSKQPEEDEQGGGIEEEPRSRTRKSSKTLVAPESDLESGQRHKKSSKTGNMKQSSSGAGTSRPAPVTASGGRGLTDTELGSSDDARPARSATTTTTTTTTSTSATPTTTTSQVDGAAGVLPATTQKQGRRLKAFPSPLGAALKDWLPDSLLPGKAQVRGSSQHLSQWAADDEQPDSGSASGQDLKVRATTQAPVHSTLPESDGNADLEAQSKSPPPLGTGRLATGPTTGSRSLLDTAASTQASHETTTAGIHGGDYVTAPSISKGFYNHLHPVASSPRPPAPIHTSSSAGGEYFEMPTGQPMDAFAHQLLNRSTGTTSSSSRIHELLSSSPTPLMSSSAQRSHGDSMDNLSQGAPTDAPPGVAESSGKSSHTARIRSHIKWIYSSWYALSILGANITGALLTLYVLTFLLMKNCDGSLNRDNQGVRSMHLLAIIVVFFGSTLFIVYPTPGLCLLRTSWHSFALVMLFGSLLLQAMQTRSLATLGLGGRPDRVNQFLTLVFMVGVQVAYEIQRWKYESANYLNFVNQYFGSAAGRDDEKKLMLLNSAISDQFNPLNSFNDQVTPVSIQISEHYQSLLQDYCLQRADDFLQSQLYLCVIVALLVVFSVSNRRNRLRLSGGGVVSSSSATGKLGGTVTSGKLVASQHEANLNLSSPSHFQFATPPGGGGGRGSGSIPAASVNTGNIFMVTIISAFTYSISIVLHLYGQNYTTNRDLISSVTMVLIAFTALIGIFLPILLQIHRFDCRNNNSGNNTYGQTMINSLGRSIITQPKLQDQNSPSAQAFALFPEFAPTGLRRLSSSDSDSGAGSRRTFAETRESRRNMGAALANLGPSADSLRSMGFYQADNNNGDNNNNNQKAMDPALLNLKLNFSSTSLSQAQQAANDAAIYGTAQQQQQFHNQAYHTNNNSHHHHHHHHQPQQQQQASSRKAIKGGEKRLIMLDVDPCCPRHGVGNASKDR